MSGWLPVRRSWSPLPPLPVLLPGLRFVFECPLFLFGGCRFFFWIEPLDNTLAVRFGFAVVELSCAVVVPFALSVRSFFLSFVCLLSLKGVPTLINKAREIDVGRELWQRNAR